MEQNNKTATGGPVCILANLRQTGAARIIATLIKQQLIISHLKGSLSPITNGWLPQTTSTNH